MRNKAHFFRKKELESSLSVVSFAPIFIVLEQRHTEMFHLKRGDII